MLGVRLRHTSDWLRCGPSHARPGLPLIYAVSSHIWMMGRSSSTNMALTWSLDDPAAASITSTVILTDEAFVSEII